MVNSTRRVAVLVLAATTALVLAGCGSAVAPEEFINANQAGNARGLDEGVVADPGQDSGVLGEQVPTGGPSGAPGGGSGGSGDAGADSGALGGAGGSGSGGQSGADSGTGAGSGGGAGGGGAGSGGGGGGAAPGASGADCSGFKNTTGISDTQITIVNASDISGPVNGLFKSAQQATQAFASYFNSASTICGRKLKVVNLDSATSSSGDQQAALKACGEAFAMVGSMSAFDDGGTQTVENCGIPDLRAIMVTPQRSQSNVSYAADAITVSQIPRAQFDYFKKISGDGYKKAAMLYLGAGAAAPNARSFMAAQEKMGYNFVYTKAIDVTTFNYSPFVSDMQSKGVKYVQWLGSYQHAIRLKQAMEQQGFKPMFVMDSVAYDKGFIASGGDAVNGTWAFVNTALTEEMSRNPELQLYNTWLNRVAPGATPTFFGMYAWGATRLFTQLAAKLGGKLSRQSLLAEIRATKGYNSNGLFAPQDVGGRSTSGCVAVIQLVDGRWVRKSKYPFICGPIVNSGV